MFSCSGGTASVCNVVQNEQVIVKGEGANGNQNKMVNGECKMRHDKFSRMVVIETNDVAHGNGVLLIVSKWLVACEQTKTKVN